MFVGILFFCFVSVGFCQDFKPLADLTQKMVDTIFSTRLTKLNKLDKINQLSKYYDYGNDRDVYYYFVFLYEYAAKEAEKKSEKVHLIVKEILIAQFLKDIREIEEKEREQRISKALYGSTKEQRAAVLDIREHIKLTEKSEAIQKAIGKVEVAKGKVVRNAKKLIEEVKKVMG